MSLTGNIVAALAGNAALAAWCDTKYGQEPTIRLGVDYDDLPAENEYPICMVQAVSSRTGKHIDNEQAVYLLTCALADDSPVERSGAGGRVMSYLQLADIESLCRLTLAAIEGADLLGGYIESVEIEHDPLEMFPIFSTNMAVTITYPAPMRGRWAT